jgi:hypothetical protein
VLNGTLIRYGVDLEAVSRAVAGAYLRRIGAHLRAHQREDLLAYLVAAAWQISERFDPKRNDDFEGYLTALLSRRPTDWYRLTIVDARHGDIEAKAAIALPYSLDAPAGSQSDPIGDGTIGYLAAGLVDPEPVGDGGTGADGGCPPIWMDRSRDRERARRLAAVRRGLSQATAA